jgi:thiol-disulfide isomerase/thioredoxin
VDFFSSLFLRIYKCLNFSTFAFKKEGMKSFKTALKSLNPKTEISLLPGMRILFFLALLLATQIGHGQGSELVKLDKLQQLIQAEKEQIQVVNFWATWCAPCLKELPLF